MNSWLILWMVPVRDLCSRVAYSSDSALCQSIASCALRVCHSHSVTITSLRVRSFVRSFNSFAWISFSWFLALRPWVFLWLFVNVREVFAARPISDLCWRVFHARVILLITIPFTQSCDESFACSAGIWAISGWDAISGSPRCSLDGDISAGSLCGTRRHGVLLSFSWMIFRSCSDHWFRPADQHASVV